MFPVLATIPDSPRFSKKPIPKPNTYVSIQGFLTRYIVNGEVAERFCIEVENVVFLGRPHVPAETPGKYLWLPKTPLWFNVFSSPNTY